MAGDIEYDGREGSVHSSVFSDEVGESLRRAVALEGQPRSWNALTRACAQIRTRRSITNQQFTVCGLSTFRPVSALRPGERIPRSRGRGANAYCQTVSTPPDERLCRQVVDRFVRSEQGRISSVPGKRVRVSSLNAQSDSLYGLEDRFILQSSDYRTIDEMHDLNPRIRTCQLSPWLAKTDYLELARQHHAMCMLLRLQDADATVSYS